MDRRMRIALFVVGMILIGSGMWRGLAFSGSATVISDRNKRGFAIRVFFDVDGTLHKSITFLPYARESTKRPPVILYLNGFRENGEDGLMHLAENHGVQVWEMKRRFPFIVVAPQCPSGESWDLHGSPFQRALRILDAVIAEENADRNRVYLIGVSSGALPLWSIGADFPGRFAAVVPTASSPPSSATHDDLVLEGPPLAGAPRSAAVTVGSPSAMRSILPHPTHSRFGLRAAAEFAISAPIA